MLWGVGQLQGCSFTGITWSWLRVTLLVLLSKRCFMLLCLNNQKSWQECSRYPPLNSRSKEQQSKQIVLALCCIWGRLLLLRDLKGCCRRGCWSCTQSSSAYAVMDSYIIVRLKCFCHFMNCHLLCMDFFFFFASAWLEPVQGMYRLVCIFTAIKKFSPFTQLFKFVISMGCMKFSSFCWLVS